MIGPRGKKPADLSTSRFVDRWFSPRSAFFSLSPSLSLRLPRRVPRLPLLVLLGRGGGDQEPRGYLNGERIKKGAEPLDNSAGCARAGNLRFFDGRTTTTTTPAALISPPAVKGRRAFEFAGNGVGCRVNCTDVGWGRPSLYSPVRRWDLFMLLLARFRSFFAGAGDFCN